MGGLTEGEAWTREVLDDLAAGRFRLGAWQRFLAESFRLAGRSRRSRPAAVRDARLLGATGVVLWILVSPAVGWSAIAGIAWWLVVTLMLEWHVGMLETPDGRQLNRLGTANVLSLARAWLVPLLPLLHGWKLGLVLIAAVASDVLDGHLARARAQTTRLGRWLDGTVDTVIVGSAGVAAMNAGIAPRWVGAVLICRAVLPWAAVGAAYFVRRESPGIAASATGRVLGGVSMGGLILAAFGLGAGACVAAAGALAGVAVVGVAIVRAANPGPRQPRRVTAPVDAE